MAFRMMPEGIVKPSLLETFTYWRPEAKFLGMLQMGGWKRPLPVYRWNCPKHGQVYSTPQGWSETLLCHDCIKGAYND